MARLHMLAYYTLPWLMMLAGCSTPTSDLVRFDYHGFSETQTAELDCVLGLMAEDIPMGAAGNVWRQVDDGTGIWGQTAGPKEALIIDLQNVPEMPYVFVHELVHVIAGQETGDRVPNHDNPTYFGPDSMSVVLGQQAMASCRKYPQT